MAAPIAHDVRPALTTPTSVGVPVVTTRPLPLSPVQTAAAGALAHSATASLSGITEFAKPPHLPWPSTVIVSQFSEPSGGDCADSRPKPATPTRAPSGYGEPAAGSATAPTLGPLRSSGADRARTATSSGPTSPGP